MEHQQAQPFTDRSVTDLYGCQTVTQWEYETLRPPREETKKESSDPKAELNELGTDGWELVTTVEYTGGGTKFLLFKRPVEEDSP